jgi:DNA-binding GntR family transcriptional regulator
LKNINNIGATVRDRVIEELRERILTAKIVPGERLDLDSISEEFGVSRTPVREALLALAHDGLAKINPRSCVIVVGLTPADIQDNFALLAMLAGMAAKWASERASEVELLRLRDLAHAVEVLALEI